MTDVSEQLIGHVFKGKAVLEYYFSLEYGTDKMSRNVVTNYKSTLRINVEEDRSHIIIS